jgi:hypothetical protein
MTAIVSLTLPAVIGPVDELLGGTPDLVWQRALTFHARVTNSGQQCWSGEDGSWIGQAAYADDGPEVAK